MKKYAPKPGDIVATKNKASHMWVLVRFVKMDDAGKYGATLPSLIGRANPTIYYWDECQPAEKLFVNTEDAKE